MIVSDYEYKFAFGLWAEMVLLYRQTNELTQPELAELLGVSVSYISQWENSYKNHPAISGPLMVHFLGMCNLANWHPQSFFEIDDDTRRVVYVGPPRDIE